MELKSLNLDKSRWALTTLGELASEVSTRVENHSESEHERFIGLKHFVSGDLKIKKWGSTSNLTSATKAFEAGDILLARRNAYLRRASLVEFDGVCSGDAFVLREKHEKIIPGFLAFIVNSSGLWDYANENAAGTMSKRVKWRDLANYEFLLPPKEHQAELAELLWAMDEAIEKGLLLGNKIDLYKQSYFEDFLRGVSVTKEKGSFAVKCKIEDIAKPEKYSCVGGPFGSNLTGKDYVDEPGVPVIRGANLTINEGKFIESAFVYVSPEKASRLKSNKAFRGDIIVTQRGTLGQVGLIPSDSKFEEYIVSQSQMKLTLDKAKALPEYIYLYLLSNRAQRDLEVATICTGIPHINLGIFKNFSILLPNIDKQKSIISQIEEIETALKSYNTQMYNSKSLQKSLINQVF